VVEVEPVGRAGATPVTVSVTVTTEAWELVVVVEGVELVVVDVGGVEVTVTTTVLVSPGDPVEDGDEEEDEGTPALQLESER